MTEKRDGAEEQLATVLEWTRALAFHPALAPRRKTFASFHVPQKTDHQNLVPLVRTRAEVPEYFQGPLETRRFRRLGGTRDLEADVRFVAATHRDLDAAVAAGAFRLDLFHRLDVFRIHVPPLRERPNDVLPLNDSAQTEILGGTANRLWFGGRLRG